MHFRCSFAYVAALPYGSPYCELTSVLFATSFDACPRFFAPALALGRLRRGTMVCRPPTFCLVPCATITGHSQVPTSPSWGSSPANLMYEHQNRRIRAHSGSLRNNTVPSSFLNTHTKPVRQTRTAFSAAVNHGEADSSSSYDDDDDDDDDSEATPTLSKRLGSPAARTNADDVPWARGSRT